MKFRKKPVIVEAYQWFPHPETVPDVYIDPTNENTGFSINTLEGKHEVSPGDWIITGIVGEKYPCKPHIFEQTYESLKDL